MKKDKVIQTQIVAKKLKAKCRNQSLDRLSIEDFERVIRVIYSPFTLKKIIEYLTLHGIPHREYKYLGLFVNNAGTSKMMKKPKRAKWKLNQIVSFNRQRLNFREEVWKTTVVSNPVREISDSHLRFCVNMSIITASIYEETKLN